MTTGTAGLTAPGIADTSDLILRLGRLAFTDPGWTPHRSRSAPLRDVADLAPDTVQAAVVVAAVHHAMDSLAQVELPTCAPSMRRPGQTDIGAHPDAARVLRRAVPVRQSHSGSHRGPSRRLPGSLPRHRSCGRRPGRSRGDHERADAGPGCRPGSHPP